MSVSCPKTFSKTEKSLKTVTLNQIRGPNKLFIMTKKGFVFYLIELVIK